MIMSGKDQVRTRKIEYDSKLKGHRNYFFYAFMIIFVGGYLFFLTSNFTMPLQGSKYFSEIFSELSVDQKTFTLISWEYSDEQNLMEVIFKIDDYSYDQNESIAVTVRDRLQGTFPADIIIHNRDLMVIQISDVSKRFTDVSCQIDIGGSGVKFYTNNEKVERVSDIKIMKEYEYYIRMLNGEINQYTMEIQDYEKDIEDVRSSINAANDTIKELRESEIYKTENEVNTIENRIEQINSDINGMENQIVDINGLIYERTLQIQNLNEQIEAIKEANI